MCLVLLNFHFYFFPFFIERLLVEILDYFSILLVVFVFLRES